MKTLSDVWREMAARPTGASSQEVADAAGTTGEKAGNAANKMRQLGKIFSGTAGYKQVRYFMTQAEADAWAEAKRSQIAIKIKRTPQPVAANWRDQEPIIPPGVKVTICPTRWA